MPWLVLCALLGTSTAQPAGAASTVASTEKVLHDLGIRAEDWEKLSEERRAHFVREWRDVQDVKRPFFGDAKSHILFAVLEGSFVFDAASSFERPNPAANERWAPMRPLLRKGPVATYAAGVIGYASIVYGGDAVCEALWQRHHRRRWLKVRRFVPIFFAVSHLVAGIGTATLPPPTVSVGIQFSHATR